MRFTSFISLGVDGDIWRWGGRRYNFGVFVKPLLGTLKQRRRPRQGRRNLKLHSRVLNKFTIIYTHLVCVKWPNYPGDNVVGAALKFERERKINHHAFMFSISCCFAKDGKKCTKVCNAAARAELSALLIRTVFSRSRCRRCRRYLILVTSVFFKRALHLWSQFFATSVDFYKELKTTDDSR